MNNICFGYYKSPIGIIKLEGNDEGITYVDFIDDDNLEFTNNNLTKPVEEGVAQLHEYFSGKRKNFDVKLVHLRGTDFQKKVWSTLCNISYGYTASYKDIATAIENPKAVRAVGGANNKNPHGIFVPWHRVIGANGALVGFAGGVWRKKWLLDFEKENI